MQRERRVLVVGGGITGLAAAVDLVADPAISVELREAGDRLGGKIATSPFAGLDHIDEAADAYLTRVPHAVSFAREVGLHADELTSPEPAGAAVWHERLHDIPGGILLGVPAAIRPFVSTSLLSWRGKLRAGAEPFLPRTDADDCLGTLIRARFGDEVHDRLVDALVGSIYATDTDRSSLAAIPQIADLADRHRSLLVGGRRLRRQAPPRSASEPIFAAPRHGMGRLVAAAAEYVTRHGGMITTGSPIESIEADGERWRIDGERYDAVVLATPARTTAPLIRSIATDAADGLATFEHADVIMVRLAVPAGEWPERLRGRSGYLVPKPDQTHVTAASFASQKWGHWRPDGSELLRISLGRDGLPVRHLDDDAALRATLAECGRHLGVELRPTEFSITRWLDAFPQYRPHHQRRIADITAALPTTVELAGASYRGIGIPACIADGRRAAARIKDATAVADRFLT